MKLGNYTRRKCFISYHHDDDTEVRELVFEFDHEQDVLIARGIGAGMGGDIINSSNDEYIQQEIRRRYLRDTSVTIVLLGRCTWARKFVDWEIAASLRNTPTANRSGLAAITLPSASNSPGLVPPARLTDNISGPSGADGYAQWWQCPEDASALAALIETAYTARMTRGHLASNGRPLRHANAAC